MHYGSRRTAREILLPLFQSLQGSRWVALGPDASPLEIRLSGFKVAALGLLLGLPGLALFLFLKQFYVLPADALPGTSARMPVYYAAPMAFGYFFLMLGFGRIVLGSVHNKSGWLISAGRILLGLLGTLGLVALALTVMSR